MTLAAVAALLIKASTLALALSLFVAPAPEPRRVVADRDGFIPVDRSWFEEGKR